MAAKKVRKKVSRAPRKKTSQRIAENLSASAVGETFGKIKEQVSDKIGPSYDVIKGRLQKWDMNTFFIFAAVILVLGIAVLAIYHPHVGGAHKNGRMVTAAGQRIVVAATGPALRSNVAPTLSTGKYFLVVDPANGRLLEAIKNPYFGKQVPMTQVAYFVAGLGEEAVLAGFINPQSNVAFSQSGINAYGGYTGRAKNAIDLYLVVRKTSPQQFPTGNLAGVQVGIGGNRGNQNMPMNPNAMMQQPGMMQQPTMGMNNMQPNGMSSNTQNPLLYGWSNPQPSMAQQQSMMMQQQPMMMQNVAMNQPMMETPKDRTLVCPNCMWRIQVKNDIGNHVRCPFCGIPTVHQNMINQNGMNQGMGANNNMMPMNMDMRNNNNNRNNNNMQNMAMMPMNMDMRNNNNNNNNNG